jgi:hypothetical protein
MQPLPRIVAIHQAEKARPQSFVKLLLEGILRGKKKSTYEMFFTHMKITPHMQQLTVIINEEVEATRYFMRNS